MSEIIKNRYEFTILFDVETATPTEIPMPPTCRASIPKPASGSLPTCA